MILTTIITSVVVICLGVLVTRYFAGRGNGLPVAFDGKLFLALGLCFIPLPAVITVTHECGHYLAARAEGHKHPRVHYQSTDTGRNEVLDEYRAVLRRNRSAIDHYLPFPEQEHFRLLNRQVNQMIQVLEASHYSREIVIISAAGPLETMLTGTLGLALILVFRRRFVNAVTLAPWQWALIFASLFWVADFFALVSHFVKMITMRDNISDLYKICIHFGIYKWTLDIAAGVMGLAAFIITIRFVPVRQRFTLLAAAFAGGLTGILLWMYAGPLLLP